MLIGTLYDDTGMQLAKIAAKQEKEAQRLREIEEAKQQEEARIQAEKMKVAYICAVCNLYSSVLFTRFAEGPSDYGIPPRTLTHNVIYMHTHAYCCNRAAHMRDSI